MDLLKLLKRRRSIRRYQVRQISRSDMEAILEAGTYAPNAGGGQRSMIVGIRDAALTEKIGRMNLLRDWGVPETYIARCFVLLGYVNGEYPDETPRRAGRSKIVKG